jgi:hypothetical protein
MLRLLVVLLAAFAFCMVALVLSVLVLAVDELRAGPTPGRDVVAAAAPTELSCVGHWPGGYAAARISPYGTANGPG